MRRAAPTAEGAVKRLGQKNRVSSQRNVVLPWYVVKAHDPALAREARDWARAFGYDVTE